MRIRGRLRRHVVAVSMVTGAALLAPACETERLEPGWELHPTEENAPPPDAVALTDDSVPPGLAGEPLERWLDARERLRGARTIARIGSEEEGPQLFGDIRDARVDQEGRLVVLDYQARSVRFFGPGGDYLHGFGEYGEGPMEWKTAYGLELLGPSRLAVFVGGRRAKVFVHGTGEWQLDSIVNLPVSVDDNCAFEDRLFLQGVIGRPPDEHALFYEMSDLGSPDAVPYGRGYQDGFFMVRDGISEGQIACVPALNQVVFAFQFLSSVRSYSAGSGGVLWSAYVENYIQPEIQANPATGSIRYYHGLPNDYLATVLAMPSGHVALQYQRYGEMSDLRGRPHLSAGPRHRPGFVDWRGSASDPIVLRGRIRRLVRRPYPRLEMRVFQRHG